MIEGTNLTFRDFWNYHVHIVTCLKMSKRHGQRLPREPAVAVAGDRCQM